MPQGLVEYLLVAVGGALGCCARHAVTTALPARGDQFPWGTFVANVTGSFVLALVMSFVAGRTLQDPRWRLVLAVGFCGGFTTFSTLLWDTSNLLQVRQALLATSNVTFSFVAGLAAVKLGTWIAERV